MDLFLAGLLSALFLGSLMLYQAGRALPLKELRRRARSGKDKPAAAVYKMAAHGSSLNIFLWLVGTLALSGLVLLAAGASGWLGLALLLVASFVAVSSQPLHATGSVLWRISAFLAPAVASLLSRLQPVLGRVGLIKRPPPSRHSGIFEKEDLLEFLGDSYHGSRLSESEIKLAIGALTFADKKISDAMVEAQNVKLVAQADIIGPHLMDELHASGLKYFPVVKDTKKSAKPEIIGTLYLKDVIRHAGEGKVSQIMKPEVNYIHESQNLHQALAAFTKTQNHMFVVTNNFEEFTGILTLEDVITQILGQPPEPTFDRYDSLLAVAGMEEGSQTGNQAPPAEIPAEEQEQTAA